MEVWNFLKQIEPRFYQERHLGLDLYQSGIGGCVVAVLAVASIVVFLLAIFHVIPVKKHVVVLLVSLGSVSMLIGALATYWHATHLDALLVRLAQLPGSEPTTNGHHAALAALPLVVGGATLLADICGCLYMAAFWGSNVLQKQQRRARR